MLLPAILTASSCLQILDYEDKQDPVENPFADTSTDQDVLPDAPTGLVWVAIPGGSYEMGCSPNDSGCNSWEEPRHAVTVAAFEITAHEITQTQYEEIRGDNPSHFTECPNCPVEQVTWYEAQAFCEAIGGRLPAEAEWEYAARGGTTTTYYLGGDGEALVPDIAWYSLNAEGVTHPVGLKTPNDYGLYDMLGNISEWVEDCIHENFIGAPSEAVVWEGGDCSGRMLRGGAFTTSTEWGLRVSFRTSNTSGVRRENIGFRCVR